MVSIVQAGDVVSLGDVTMAPGDNITIPIMIYDATRIAAVGVNLSYHPYVVNLTDAHQGDFTGFFGFDNRNATDGWVLINTYMTCRDLTGDLKVADVTLVAVGRVGDASPLNLEILAMADRDGTNVPGIPRNGTFRILAQAPASTIQTPPTTTSASSPTYPASDENDGNGGAHTNIVMREIKCVYASKCESISCEFENLMNDITHVNFTTTIHAGDICAIVEVLEGTSASVEADPPDNVYRNINIRVGLSRYATERDVRGSNITFGIDQGWLNTVDQSTVALNVYHDGAWHPLKTTRLGEDKSHAYFMADTSYFGRFAITASDLRAVPTPVYSPATEQTDQPPEQTTPTKPSAGTTLHSIPGCGALPGLIGLVIACLLRRR